MTESSDDGKKLSSTMKRSLAPGKESSPEKTDRMPDFSEDEWSAAVERAEEKQRLKEEQARSRKLGTIRSDYEGKKGEE